jgi:hypothetical protein
MSEETQEYETLMDLTPDQFIATIYEMLDTYDAALQTEGLDYLELLYLNAQVVKFLSDFNVDLMELHTATSPDFNKVEFH